jgi:hypothetical protein
MDVPLEIERVDIEREVGVFERYALRIPVLQMGERELDVAGLDEAAIVRWMHDVTPPR